MKAKVYLVRNPAINMYRITIKILLSVLRETYAIPLSELKFGHSPDEGRSTPVKEITKGRGNYHVDAGKESESRIDNLLGKW